MTVSTTTNKVQYNCNGAQVAFNYPNPFFATSDIVVIKTDTSVTPNVDSTLVLGTDYTIAGNQDVNGQFPTGGVVTTTVAYAATQRLTLNRVLTQTQGISLVDGDPMPAGQVMNMSDRLTLILQQIAQSVAACLQTAVSDTVALNPLPNATSRANLFLAFDAAGQAIASPGPLVGIAVSGAMNPVVTAGTLALARTAMGLSSVVTELLGSTVIDDPALPGNLTTKTPINAQAGVNYAIVAGDRCKFITRTNAGAMADTLPDGATIPNGWETTVKVLPASVGSLTITPAAGLIDGLASIVVQPGGSVRIQGGGANYNVMWGGKRGDYIKLSHTLASGTNGGATAAATQNQRPFNTKDFDTAGICTLAANQFTIPAGTYSFKYRGALFNPNTKGRPRLRNTTAGTTTLIGVGHYAAANTGMSSAIDGRFTITVSSVFEVDEYTGGAEALDGLGAQIGTGENEVYATAELERF